MSGDPAIQPRWPPWLKIEHRGKMQFLVYISETKAFRANLIGGKNLNLSTLKFSDKYDNWLSDLLENFKADISKSDKHFCHLSDLL